MTVTINFDGHAKEYHRVSTIEQAVRYFVALRDCFEVGASDMLRGCGDIKNGPELVGKIAYNGRVFYMDKAGAWQEYVLRSAVAEQPAEQPARRTA